MSSGVPIRKTFEIAGGKSGDQKIRQVFAEISDDIRKGSDISSAMRRRDHHFPNLMIDMVAVAEQSGNLPEVLEHLADHYENNVQLRRSFFSAIAWPVFQLVAAILVIALLIVILGMISGSTGENPMSFLVFGLSGTGGAAIWLTCTFGSFFMLFVVYKIASKSFVGKNALDPLLMKIPVLGTCMRSFAIARFSWAYYLTQQTGMPVVNSLDASLRATTNGAFIAALPLICQRIEEGDEFAEALRASRLFPEDYLEMVIVGETSGTVPETLQRLSPEFEDQARRSLKALTSALGWLVWLIVAGFIIFFILRFIMGYVKMITDLTEGTF